MSSATSQTKQSMLTPQLDIHKEVRSVTVVWCRSIAVVIPLRADDLCNCRQYSSACFQRLFWSANPCLVWTVLCVCVWGGVNVRTVLSQGSGCKIVRGGHILLYINIVIYIDMYMHICIYICILYTYMHIEAIHIYLDIYTYAYIYIYIYIYICTYTYMCIYKHYKMI